MKDVFNIEVQNICRRPEVVEHTEWQRLLQLYEAGFVHDGSFERTCTR